MSQDMAGNPQATPKVPTLDDVAPPLTSRALKTDIMEKYEGVRGAVARLLHQLKNLQRRYHSLREDFLDISRANEALRNDLAQVRDQLINERRARELERRDLSRALLTVSQFTLLTGLEAKNFQFFHQTDRTHAQLTFKAGDYTVTVTTGISSHLALKGKRQKEMSFSLTWAEGAIPTQAALAIMNLMGIQRDHKEAFTEQVYHEIYDDSGMPSLEEHLGRVALTLVGPDCGDPNCSVHGAAGGPFG